jgi:hypothetical protein
VNKPNHTRLSTILPRSVCRERTIHRILEPRNTSQGKYSAEAAVLGVALDPHGFTEKTNRLPLTLELHNLDQNSKEHMLLTQDRLEKLLTHSAP